MLTFEYVDGEQIAKSFCNEENEGWWICGNGNRHKPIDGGYYDSEGNLQGKFIIEFSSGSKYFGEFKDNLKRGQGTYNWASGNKYVGEWKNDLHNGQGTFTFANGKKWVGEWKYGNLNGYAIQYNADGSIYREGIFKDDEFLHAKTSEKKEPSKLDKYKSTCEELGFTPGTEKFGDCVIKLID